MMTMLRMPGTARRRTGEIGLWALVLSAAALLGPVAWGATAGTTAEASSGDAEYVCPPCGSDCHDEVFAGSGTCPVCGMKLVRKGEEVREQATHDENTTNVGILIFDGVQIIDYTGPYEVFGQAGFRVFTISETGKTITTSMGMSVNPKYGFRDSPNLDILVVPGGVVDPQYRSGAVIDWVRAKADGADHVLSVCNGAFILAKTGLLDGGTATTFYGLIDSLKEFAPHVTVVADQRYVDNGKIITSAGLSSGIDASLYLVSKVLGRGRAQQIALHMEYDWRPESDFARAALADRHLPEIGEPAGAEVQIVSTRGGRDRWEARYSVTADLTLDGLIEHVHAELQRLDNWSRIERGEIDGGAVSTWGMIDDGGSGWRSIVRIEPDPRGEDRFTLTIDLRRASGRNASL